MKQKTYSTNNIKAVFFDIDGTLLSHKINDIPDSTLKALDLLKAKGIKVFIATGRHITEMAELTPLKKLSMDGYITLNGAYCFNGEGVYYDHPVDHDEIKIIIYDHDQKPYPCMFVEADRMYISSHNDHVVMVQEAIHTSLPPIGDIHRGYDHKIYMVIPYCDDEREEELMNKLHKVKTTRWHKYAIDMIPDDGGKEVGLEKTCEHYGIKRDETMAFGDGDNDITMIKWAGVGVAMGNSDDLVKQEADFVTKSIDEEGILYACKYYGLIDDE